MTEPTATSPIEPEAVASMALAELDGLTWAGAELSTVVRMWGVGTEYAIVGGPDHTIVTVYPRDGFDALPRTASSRAWLFPVSEAGFRAAVAFLTEMVVSQAKAEGDFAGPDDAPAGCFCKSMAEPKGCLTCTCPNCGAVGRFGGSIAHRRGCKP